MTKALKIVGIIFLVAALLFGGTYLTIHLLNKKTEQYEVFADSKVWFMGVAGYGNGLNGDTLSETIIEDSEYVGNAMALKYNYLKPYFSTVGVNASQKKQLKKQIEQTTNSVLVFEDYFNSYSLLKNHTAFYVGLVPSYINVINNQVKLNDLMEEILLENGTILNEKLLFFFELNDALVDVAVNTTFKGVNLHATNSFLNKNDYLEKNEFISGNTADGVHISIRNINNKISSIIHSNSLNIDVTALKADNSYKAFTSTISMYNNHQNALNDDELKLHYKGLHTNSDGKINESVKTANSLYSRLINICKSVVIEMKISPFDTTTQQVTNKLALLF